MRQRRALGHQLRVSDGGHVQLIVPHDFFEAVSDSLAIQQSQKLLLFGRQTVGLLASHAGNRGKADND